MIWTLHDPDSEAVKAAPNYEEHKEELLDGGSAYPEVLMKGSKIIKLSYQPEPEDATLSRSFYWLIELLNEHAS